MGGIHLPPGLAHLCCSFLLIQARLLSSSSRKRKESAFCRLARLTNLVAWPLPQAGRNRMDEH